MKLSHRGFWIKGLGLSLALGAGLVGCAVLTVDVDVYKGALVNEEHVQLHQLTALATAAKPMLVGLRNDLEWPYKDGMPPAGPQKCPTHDHYWYEQGHVQEPLESMPKNPWIMWRHELPYQPSTTKQDATCWKGFQNPMARRVNRILHLYEDLGTEDLSFYAKKMLDAQAQMQAAQSILEGDQKRDPERAALVKKGFKSSSHDTPDKLKDAYTTLLRLDVCEQPELSSCGKPGSPVRKAGPLIDALKGIADSEKKTTPDSKDDTVEKTVERKLIENWKDTNNYVDNKIDKIYERRLPFRAVWKLLAEADKDSTLAKATQELFNTDAQGKEAHKILTDWVQELTGAYWHSLEATHELWEVSLRLLIQLDRLERNEPGRYRTVLDQAINVVAQLTSVQRVASALERVNSDGRCSSLDQALISGLACDSAGPEKQAIWTEDKVRTNPERYEVLLRRALFKTPADTAYFLLDLNQMEKGAAPTNTSNNVNALVGLSNKGNVQHMVRLGLNRNAVDEDGQDDYQRLVQQLSRGLAGGFERGRLLYGIHTWTEKYLQAHDRATETRASRHAKDTDEKIAEEIYEQRLLDVLVEFAEKVRFLANHEGLSSPPGTSGLIFGGAEKVTRGLMGDRVTDNSIYRWINGLEESKKQRYVRVLQAVGNSILFSANELRERERHREQGEKRVAAEVMAAKSVYSPDPAKVLTDLLVELEHDKQVAQTALDDANTRKPTIDEQLQTFTNEQRTASQKLAEITRKIDDYQKEFTPVEATYQVLLHYVSNEDKEKWKAGWGEIKSDPDKFLASDDESLGSKLGVARPGATSPAKDEDSKFASAISYIQLPNTKNAFKEYLKPVTITKQSELLDGFITYIKKLESERREQIAGYKTEHDVQTGELDRANGKIVRLKAEAKQILELARKIDRLETARTEISSVQGGVLKEAEAFKEAKGGVPFVSPETIYSLIRSHLEKKPTDSSQMAQTVLLSRTAPPGMPPPDPNSFKSPIEVMDTVIALLRHRHMEVVERFGEGSPEGKKATEALENAYRHRAGMIYIRPSSAYLRTSFPSTSLQDDPNLAWDNMLLKQGLRNLPFSSELRDILNPSVKQDQVLTSELDKQYWQNINRVRVSGAGATNQALVKDDVGNWYVKQYFGKTDQIWESAKNLALFSMSAKVPIDLAKQLNKASNPEEYAENSKESPTLQKVLERHQGVYKTHTVEIQAKLDRLHDKELKETLIAAWDAHKNLKDDVTVHDGLGQALEAEITVWNKAATALKGKAAQDPGQAIVKDVGGLSRLGRMLSARITEIITQEEKGLEEKQKTLAEKLGKETLEAKKTELETEKQKLETKKTELEKKRKIAVFEVHKTVGGQVTNILTDRNRVLDHYEQAIVFIGDAANPKDPNSKQ